MRIRSRIDDRQARRAFAESPEVMMRAISAKLEAGAQLVARTARTNASKHTAFGQLQNAIKVEKVHELHYRVVAGVAHARMVEEGTGPAAGRRRYVPDAKALEQYVKVRAGIRWARARSKKRRSQEREVRDRAWGLAVHIAEHGTKPHPFMEPALESHRSELHRQIQQGVWLGIAEVFGP